MDHNLFRQRQQLGRPSYVDHYNTADGNLQPHARSPQSVINQSASMVETQLVNFSARAGNSLLSAKRHREHHLIIASSQDDEDHGFSDDHHDDDSMMDCYDGRTGQNKRRRFSYSFPFDHNGQIIHIQKKQEEINCDTNVTLVVEDCVAMNNSSNEKGNPSVEWWRKKRPLVNSSPSAAVALDSKPADEEASSSSAMDTSADDEICCHICQKMFPIPTVPSVREVMPANALLNYFSPLNKKSAVSNGDVEMATNITQCVSSPKNWTNSPACCRCCDRPSCPECRRQCEVCQQSFCSFCSIARDGAKSNSCFCLDCYDQLR